MMKLLVVLLVVAVALWALLARSRGAGRSPSGRRPVPPPAPGGASEDMVRCAHCGVHLPATDALQAAGRSYCGPDHAAAGPRQT